MEPTSFPTKAAREARERGLRLEPKGPLSLSTEGGTGDLVYAATAELHHQLQPQKV